MKASNIGNFQLVKVECRERNRFAFRCWADKSYHPKYILKRW